MSPIAKSTTTPLLEVLPQESPKAQAKSKTQASSKERSEADGAKTHAQPTFAEVQARLERPVVNRHRPTSPIPVTTTLTSPIPMTTTLPSPIPSTIARSGHDTKTSAQSADGSVVLATRSDAIELITTPPAPAGAPMVRTAGNAPAQTRIATQGEAGAQAQAAIPPTKSITTVSSASEAGVPEVPLGKDRQIGAVSSASLPSQGGEDIGTLTAPLAPRSSSVSISRAPLIMEGSPRSHISSSPPPSDPSNQVVRTKAGAGVYNGAQLFVGQSRVPHQPAPVGPLVEMNGSSPLQRLDMASPPSVPVAGATGEAMASSPLGQLGTIVAQVVREGNLPRTITIALEPKELGQLQLQVTSNGGEIQVHIQVADPLTRGIVSQQLGDLTNALQRDLGFGGQQTGGQGRPSESSPSDGVPMLDATPIAGVVSGSPTAVVAHSLVDVRL
ncbi:MAG: flagellar hook-length control protein FliK [Ferrimicrobium sp.]